MIKYSNPEYILNGDLSGDIIGEWIHTLAFEDLYIEHDVAAGASSRSFLGRIEGTNDPAKAAPLAVGAWVGISGGVADSTFETRSGPFPEWIRLNLLMQPGGAGGPGEVTIRVIGRQR